MNDIDVMVRDLVLRQIAGQVRGADMADSPMGPPCSAFYLLHYATGEPRIEADTRRLSSRPGSPDVPAELAALLAAERVQNSLLSRSRLLGLWRVTLSGVEELPVELKSSVTVGETRGALFENAKVSLWIDSDRGLAYLDWVYGPLYARGFTYTIRSDGDGISLDDEQLRWMS